MPAKKKSPAPANIQRRSPCPVACALDIVGDRWTLLVVRDLLLGRTRFKEFVAAPESIPTNILTDRLERLLEHKVIERIAAADGSKHGAYQLTSKGKALHPVVTLLRDWGLAWEDGTKAMIKALPPAH